jgi:nicotinamidase-related amidase
MSQTGKQALLLLDLQNEMIDPQGKIGKGGLAAVIQERSVIENAACALEQARVRNVDVAHVRLGFRADYLDALSVAPRVTRMKEHGAAILGTWGTEFPNALRPRESELVVTKQCVNPFFNTGLMSWLQHRKIDRLLLGGVATNLVVEMAARVADDAGFTVTVLEDLCAAPNPTWHAFSIENILPLFATVTASAGAFA